MAEQSGDGARTRARIIASARIQVLLSGEAATSSGRVAAEVKVSKALVHYHFAEKRDLLKAVASACSEAIRSRQETSLGAAPGGSVIDEHREWLIGELDARDLETLIQLMRSHDADIAAAATRGVRTFRSMMASRVSKVLTTLELPLVIRTDLVTDLMATAVIGLASSGRAERESDARAIIDTLWLAVLRLTR